MPFAQQKKNLPVKDIFCLPKIQICPAKNTFYFIKLIFCWQNSTFNRHIFFCRQKKFGRVDGMSKSAKFLKNCPVRKVYFLSEIIFVQFSNVKKFQENYQVYIDAVC